MNATQTQQASQATAVERAADTVLGTDAGDDFDVLSLVVDDDGATPAGTSKQQDATTKATDGEPAGAASKTAAAAAATAQGDQTQQQQPGTPDKAIQKLQQDQAAIARTLNQLLELAKAGQPLTPAQQQQVQQQQRKLDVIRQKLTEKNEKGETKFDPFDDAPVLAESVIEQDERLAALEQRLAKVETGKAAADDTAVFTALRQKYPGVDVESVWDNALEAAAGIIGADNPALGNLADRIFHQRASAAAKGIATKGNKNEQQQQTTTTAASNNGTTPGANRVTVQTGVAAAAQLSEEEQYKRDALSLVD